MAMEWKMLHPQATIDHLGFLPNFLSEKDPDPAWKQIDKNYKHGGGWHSHVSKRKFKLITEPNYVLRYPGDPPIHAIAMTLLREEKIIFLEHDLVVIIQKDGTWDVSRVD